MYVGGPAGLPSPGGVGTAPIGHLDERTRTATIGPGVPDDARRSIRALPDPMKFGAYSIFSSGPAPLSTFATTANTTGRPACCSVRLPNRATQVICRTEGTVALHRLSQAIFDEHPTELKEMTWQQRRVNGQPGMRFTAQVHYAVDRLPSRYDTVTALLVRLDDGSLIMAASSVPNDADSDIARQATDALGTLTLCEA